MSYKILKVIFVILLFVTIGEAGYYFFVLKYPKSSNQNNSLQPSITASVIPSAPSEAPKQTYSQDPLVSAFIKSEPFQSINNSEVKEGQKFYITFDQAGFIGDIQYTNTDQNSAFIKLDTKAGKKIIKLILRDNMKYYKESSDSGMTSIKLSDLKMGNSVILRIREDLLDPSIKTTEFILHE